MIWRPQFQHFRFYYLKLSPFSSPHVHRPSHFPPSPQDPLLPAGLPTHLTPSYCASDSASTDQCARLQIIFTYLLTYLHIYLFLRLREFIVLFVVIFSPGFCFIFSVQANNLAGKSVSEITYCHLNSISQLYLRVHDSLSINLTSPTVVAEVIYLYYLGHCKISLID